MFCCFSSVGRHTSCALVTGVQTCALPIFASGDAVVILGGGDGTMNAAAPALRVLGRPFGLLPLGTANDLARSLGIPFDPAGAADVIVAGASRRIDQIGRASCRERVCPYE